ncbi:hypothetical protein UA08_03221 [Talaromyces atroroseus]|uniref:Uncharacterized protein n=1 Tax=Talaromyces atroroseus TaxID=1441469 RepID=A0A225AHJ7_TALAT|nr:hypothetical protein UA08_03221 [Talaromyces atroroseus]OKL60901.1 hypothetical protein UA08_03221 [Talaromyces atroroseus]
MGSSMVRRVPLEVAMQIVEAAKLSSIADTRNMLTAFEWRLPDSYWQSKCDMDLIFEYDDLRKTNALVDWQFLALATEELLENPGWFDNSGLRIRRQTFDFLKQIKDGFLNLIEKNKKQTKSWDDLNIGSYRLRRPYVLKRAPQI